jgi:ABC-type Fe3+-hydroxamate transport system substrate-binding protein
MYFMGAFPPAFFGADMAVTVQDKRDAREKFVELANKRVTRAIKDLRLVGNLANRRNYTYDEADAKKVIRALQREMDALKARFRGDDGGENSVFSL